MRTCEDLERYLDRRLAAHQAIEFEEHLPACPTCEAGVELWRAAARDLADAGTHRPVAPPSPAEVALLVATAAAGRGRTGWVWIAAAATALVVGCAVAIALFETGPKPIRSTDVPEIAGTLSLESVTRDVDPEQLLRHGLTVSKTGSASLRIGDDAIDLSPGSSFALVEVSAAVTHVRLDAGKVTCVVARRGPGREFVVDAADYRVRVTGTRFTVAISGQHDLDVRVQAGTVEVSRGGTPIRRLAAGERLEIPEQAIRATQGPVEEGVRSDAGQEAAATRRGGRSAAAPEAPTIETLRSWIIGGQYADAETELRARLARIPSDVIARSLLADCLRKQGRWGEAADAYIAVAATDDPELATRARLLAGEILSENLGRHAEAVSLFSGYLDAAGPATPLRAEALVRLARSLLALGRIDEARERLEEVVSKHSGTTIALEAKRLLEELDRKGEGNGRPAQ